MIAVASCAWLGACVSDDPATSGEGGGGGEVPVPSVTAPAERRTPFCQAMIELSDRLETDPPDDVTALIVETYTAIADEVPDAIAGDFGAVLTALRTGTDPTARTTAPAASPPPSSDPLSDEGFLPSDDPADQVSAWVDANCRDVQNNPGPPATQPLQDITPTSTPISDPVATSPAG
jgi:hypothetical protein